MAVTQRKKPPNHPSHHHHLAKADTREIYAAYQAKWHCDACERVLDGMKETFISSEDSEEPDNRMAYHCHQCNYDICTQCFKGNLHPFHTHRLKKAVADILYPETGGQWRCDGCKRVFSELTERDCYTCLKCQKDLCKKCYKGEWKHALHNSEGHKLMPVHPEIEYRYFYDWSCDNCQRIFTDANTPEVFFRCTTCQYGLCPDCFTGVKHHLHQHNLVEVNTGQLSKYCSHCHTAIKDRHAHVCRDPSCSFILCNKCHYSSEPKSHPFHPAHPLELCDAAEMYPQSGGMWHCDRCTSSSPYKEPSPLQPTDPMYHCEKCQFDLCEPCYLKGLKTERSEEHLVRPTEVEGRPSSRRYYLTEPPVPQRRPVTGMQPLHYLHKPYEKP